MANMPSDEPLTAVKGKSEGSSSPQSPSSVSDSGGVVSDRPDADATVIGIRPSAADAATIVPGGSATIVSANPAQRTSIRRSPPPPGAGGLPAAVMLQIGSALGNRYEILELLGEGGMGAVYKAADLEVDRIVALKVIRPEMASHPEILARFKQELLLSSQITHRNVIRIYDLGEAEGVKFITMEYIEGKDLRSVLHERKILPPEEAVDIAQQVCRALEAAHSVGIIHRDLKPQNVMMDRSGRVVVMDFGLARTLAGDGMTQTGAMLGTMEYMSPEQALGKNLDQRSDIFALGLILYELLAGERPFVAESALASLIKRTQESAVPVLDRNAEIPGMLGLIVDRCLERNLDTRYQTVAEILSDLTNWKDATPAGKSKVKDKSQAGGVPPALHLASDGDSRSRCSRSRGSRRVLAARSSLSPAGDRRACRPGCLSGYPAVPECLLRPIAGLARLEPGRHAHHRRGAVGQPAHGQPQRPSPDLQRFEDFLLDRCSIPEP